MITAPSWLKEKWDNWSKPFDAAKQFARIEEWLLKYMEENGTPETPVIVGLSGGKDSTITAAACAKILGPSRVLGISMPDSHQTSDDAYNIAQELGIKYDLFPVAKITALMLGMISFPNDTVKWNLAPRIRMTMLYMIANQLSGRVANTCNLSETWVGYDTRWGDQCGDFSLFQNYTATEVKEIGRYLGVSEKWIEVPPSDGLCGMTDEERWGFTYKELDTYLRGQDIDPEVEAKIRQMNRAAIYKIISIKIPAVSY